MSIRALSDIFDELITATQNDTISFGDLLGIFHERGFGALLFIIALPAALPIPAVGYGTILAFPLLLLTAQQVVGRYTIWLPRKARAKTLSSQSLRGTIERAQPWLKRIERLTRPRLEFITQGFFSRLIGLAGFIMACSVLLPLPLTNTVPSIGIAVMAIGVLMRDGVAVIAGMMIGLVWVGALLYFILTFGPEGIEMMKNLIKSVI